MDGLSISPVELGFLVGLFPAVSMLTASLALTAYEISTQTAACFQNFCAGLIIAAVAGELYPLLSEGTVIESAAGEVIGFISGLGNTRS
jgi:hypothetical protein